jgi:4-hydroxythreonine-4-phosphate dehydrogenase
VAAAPDRVRLAVTLGDPRGIGPEVVRKALADPRVTRRVQPVVVGPGGTELSPDEDVGRWHAVSGVVTAPIDKAALLAGGYDYPGHTEMLAQLAGADVAMMLASSTLRVVLATTHIPLRDVPDAVTGEAIERAARVTRDGLRRWFGIGEPRIALCALNPHGGDGGRFGREDDDVLAPAARRLDLAGPYPADTVFVRAMRGAFDAVIAPYHDVGMTAIKVASFGHAVNVTLGLPFPRTSPDHGTALDIAGRGVADPSSLVEALLLCADIVERQRRTLGVPAA